MDEIIRQPKTRPAAYRILEERAPRFDWNLRLRDRFHRFSALAHAGALEAHRRAVYGYYVADSIVGGRKRISALPYLAAAGVAALALIVSTVYTPSYVVSANGIELGTVTDQAVFERAVERVEARASSILGYDYVLDQEITYQFALTQRDKISPIATFETYLFNQVGEVMKTHTLTVDGRFIGAGTEADLNAMLARLAEPYVTEHTVSVTYDADVQMDYGYIPFDVCQDLDEMEAILSENINGETTYEVVKGDTYSGIAYDNDMSLDELMALNPQASLDRLMIGDVLTVRQTIPYLSVRTTDAVTYNETIACPVEEVPDSTMYQGTTKVLTAGVPGEAQVTANVTYLNGYEESREVISTLVLSEPTTEVVAVGTKERPRTMPTGSFQWPVYGHISSRFGSRYIFGSSGYHSGIDIATAYGTTIAASDGGTVVWSGTGSGSYWSYGNYVVIDHGNGVKSYYAHCSSLLVSAGDKVYKGQPIARVGSTGRSTGNHCHFGININGSFVNPISYLP